MKCKIVCCCALVLAAWAALAADRSDDASIRTIELIGYAIAGGLSWRIIKCRNRAAEERNAREAFRKHRTILNAEGKLDDSICWFCGKAADGTANVGNLERAIPCCSACGRWVRDVPFGVLASAFAYSALVALLIYVVFRLGDKNGTGLASGLAGAFAFVGAIAIFCAAFRRGLRHYKNVLKKDLAEIEKLAAGAMEESRTACENTQVPKQ